MKTGFISVILPVWLILGSCGTGNRYDGASLSADPGQIQIVMFHLEQRCESCNAVESVTLAMLKDEFGEELSSGKLSFLPLSINSENGKKAAQKLRATGQTLYVVKGDSVSDLTGPAFMFANTHPETYRSALRIELEKFLK